MTWDSIGLIGFLILSICLSSHGLAAETTFTQVNILARGYLPHLSDMDGDGDLDIVALKDVGDWTGSKYQPYWYENKGAGKFVSHSMTELKSMYAKFSLADINGDGKMDAVFTMVGLDYIGWLENDGATSPNFILHQVVNIIDILKDYDKADICAADINGDGRMDVVASYYHWSTSVNKGLLYWYENDGANPPGFTAHPIAETQKPQLNALAVADVDGDGRADVLMGEVSDSGTAMFRNLGGNNPAFARGPVCPTRGQIAVADLNGDGRQDVLVGFSWAENRGGEPTTFTTHLLAPDFKPVDYNHYGVVTVGDLDHNGTMDPVTYDPAGATSMGRNLYWFQNDGRSSPTLTRHMLGASHSSPAIGDLEGDGNPDIVCVDSTYGDLVEYRNQLTTQSVTVLAPNDAGRVFSSGGTMTIHWRTDVAAAGKTVVLELWRGTKTKIAWLVNSTSDLGRGEASVTLPPVPTGSDYRIRALSAANRALGDFSDERFCIRKIPNGVGPASWACYP